MEPRESFQKFQDDHFLAVHTLNDKTVLECKNFQIFYLSAILSFVLDFYLSPFYNPASLNQKRRRGIQVDR